MKSRSLLQEVREFARLRNCRWMLPVVRLLLPLRYIVVENKEESVSPYLYVLF